MLKKVDRFGPSNQKWILKTISYLEKPKFWPKKSEIWLISTLKIQNFARNFAYWLLRQLFLDLKTEKMLKNNFLPWKTKILAFKIRNLTNFDLENPKFCKKIKTKRSLFISFYLIAYWLLRQLFLDLKTEKMLKNNFLPWKTKILAYKIQNLTNFDLEKPKFCKKNREKKKFPTD